MKQYLASSQFVHLEGLYHIFEYHSNNEISRVVFNTFQPNIHESLLASGTMDWKDSYGDIEEELPYRMPKPLGRITQMTCFVDAKHAGKLVTWCSYTGVLVYVINAPIFWFSKKHNTDFNSIMLL